VTMSQLFDSALVLLGVADLIARLRLGTGAAPWTGRAATGEWIIVYGGGLGAAALLAGAPWVGLSAVAVACLTLSLACRRIFGFLHLRGYLSLIVTAQFRVAAVAWLAYFTATAEIQPFGRALLGVLTTVAVLVLPIQLLDNFLLQEAACRTGWPEPAPRPSAPSSPAPALRPRVSVQVPCYAEPPDVVIATLDHLARLAYDNYEVVVIDNNTADEALWRPVEAHCDRLGSRFRFFHVPRLAGAKAGALNFALARTGADVELIAVVDADYQAEPGFLAELVGTFADEQVAFVQTSHDYRDWTGSPYLTGCYWEYRAMYGGYMRSRSQRRTALTTGTMCLIRRSALDQVGGWAAWCCTEDSELSVRLHAAGYHGWYVHHTYGRGVVPDEFAGYRRQRHRWIYGPTQEFRRHWRLFLPARWAAPSALTGTQKILFAHHGLRELVTAAATLAVTATTVALTVFLALSSPGPRVSPAAQVGLAAGALSGMLVLWPLLRRVVGCSRTETTRAIVCRMALLHTRLSAGLAGWRSTSGTFRRTSKFPASSTWRKALTDTTREALRGVAALGLAGWALAESSPGSPLLLPAGYLVIRSACWLAAPALSLSADRSLRAARPGGRAQHAHSPRVPRTVRR
jgi:glycosyl transferase family 2